LAVVSVNVCGVLPVDDPVVCRSVNVIDCVFGSTNFGCRTDELDVDALGTVILTEAVRKPLGKVVEPPPPDPLPPDPETLGASELPPPPPPQAARTATMSSAMIFRLVRSKVAYRSKPKLGENGMLPLGNVVPYRRRSTLV
jgi:hypothetical protein